MELAANICNPEGYTSWICECIGRKVAPEIVEELWPKILEHKWLLSQKLGRDLGTKVACLDFIENMQPMQQGGYDAERLQILKDLEAQMVDRSVWETISESQPPKQIVNKRIILPLTATELARKHSVIPPRTIILFGPPGTGKTHFVRAIAGILQWWYVEVSPSVLMADGQDRLGANLKKFMEKARNLDEVVFFVDEFEEIAGSRDHASRIEKSITNEFLKQVSLFKGERRKSLLLCATNYIRQLDGALLRPGRFDCIIPVGGLDDEGRRTIFEHYLSNTNVGEVNTDKIISLTTHFTPADIEYLFQKLRQHAFEREYIKGEDYCVTTGMFLDMIREVPPTLTDKIVEGFEHDCAHYSRY